MVRNVYGTNSLWYEKSGSRTEVTSQHMVRKYSPNTVILEELDMPVGKLTLKSLKIAHKEIHT